MSEQLRIEAFTPYFREKWNPQPALDARIRNYLQGFAAHGREIYARRKHIAKQLGIGIRTLSRYFRHYREIGWLETVKRTARTAIRQLTEKVDHWPIAGTSIEVEPEVSQNLLKQNTNNAPCSGGQPCEATEGARRTMPLGYSEEFRDYIGIFHAAGKPMNLHDEHRAHAAWIGIGPDQWAAATQDALRICQKTSNVRYLPMPVNHLLDEGWTRTAAPRTLPLVEEPTAREAAWNELMGEL